MTALEPCLRCGTKVEANWSNEGMYDRRDGYLCDPCGDELATRRQSGFAKYDGEYLYGDAIDQLTPGGYLIDGILPDHGYGLLIGRDGTLKSFLALDWGLCLATAKPWQGRPLAPVPCKDPADEDGCRNVLFIAGEGAYGLAPRKKAWQKAWDRNPGDRFVIRKRAVNFFAQGEPFADLLERTEGEFDVVIIDTLRRISGNANQNLSDMGVVIDGVARIVEQGALVLVIAHTDGHDTDTRGWTGIEDDSDFVWHAKRDDKTAPVTVTNTKMKDGPDGLIIRLQPHTIELDDVDNLGRPITSLVLEAADSVATTANTEAETRVLGVMRETFAETGATSSELLEVLDMPKSTFYLARGRLLRVGLLVQGERRRLALPPLVQGHETPTDQPLSNESKPVQQQSIEVQSSPAPLKGLDDGIGTWTNGRDAELTGPCVVCADRTGLIGADGVRRCSKHRLASIEAT